MRDPHTTRSTSSDRGDLRAVEAFERTYARTRPNTRIETGEVQDFERLTATQLDLLYARWLAATSRGRPGDDDAMLWGPVTPRRRRLLSALSAKALWVLDALAAMGGGYDVLGATWTLPGENPPPDAAT